MNITRLFGETSIRDSSFKFLIEASVRYTSSWSFCLSLAKNLATEEKVTGCFYLFFLLCTCSLKFKRLSNSMSKCFTERVEVKLFLLKARSSDFSLPAFLEKYNFWACLFPSGLSCIFHWKVQSFINSFSTNVPLLYPLKTSENLRFSNIFSRYRSGTLVENELITNLCLKLHEICLSKTF